MCKKLGKVIISIGMMIILGIIGINLFTIVSTHSQVVQLPELETIIDDNVPIVVLGAGVVNNEYPSEILANRLDKAYELHLAYPNNPLIMSGDHSDQYYNEVLVMKNYLVDKGIDSNQIYLDHEGLSTYASLYRLKEVVRKDQAIIVTQGYHLSRALMIANGLSIDAVGVVAEEVSRTRLNREFREFFARVKSFSIIYLSYDGDQPVLDYGFNLDESGNITDIKENLKQYSE
ncbi:vancomycin high temperature exclusion protein [Aerococcaceae bacterium WGS1372]